VQGPKGKMRQACRPASCSRRTTGARGEAAREDAELGKFHGLARSLVANAVPA
jgi:hypothetical protein